MKTKTRILSITLTIYVSACFSQESVQSGVEVYEHRDFMGAHQFFTSSNLQDRTEYRADRGQLNKIGNDRLSSLIVPFGYCVMLCEHSDGSGISQLYEVGKHNFVSNAFNDKASALHVYPWTNIYLSTDDPMVPAQINIFGIKYNNPTDGAHGNTSIFLEFSDLKKRFNKRVAYDIPAGYTVDVWPYTANGEKEGRAGWDYKIEGNKLYVNVWVTVRHFLGPRNWMGVRAQLRKL